MILYLFPVNIKVMLSLYVWIYSLDFIIGVISKPTPPGLHGYTSDNVKTKYRGLPEMDFKAMEQCVKQVKVKVAKESGVQISEAEVYNTLFGDIAVTLEQCLKMKKYLDDLYRKDSTDLSENTIPGVWYLNSNNRTIAENDTNFNNKSAKETIQSKNKLHVRDQSGDYSDEIDLINANYMGYDGTGGLKTINIDKVEKEEIYIVHKSHHIIQTSNDNVSKGEQHNSNKSSYKTLSSSQKEKGHSTKRNMSSFDYRVKRPIFKNNYSRGKRKAVDFGRYDNTRWSMPIKYSIDEAVFSSKHMKVIQEAFHLWELKTCLRFEKVNESYVYQGSMLNIRGDYQGCWSYVGMTPIQPQILNLQPQGCFVDLSIPIHEIGHAIGLYHEHSRPDRDHYIEILPENIQENKKSNLLMATDSVTYGVPYDYGSIMHYGKNAFSKAYGLHTIVPVNPGYRFTIGQRTGISFMDATIVNKMYKCVTSELIKQCKKSDITCMNGGYVDPGLKSDPSNCTCRCPDGLGGNCSQTIHGSTGCEPSSGIIDILDNNVSCVMSPNYGSGTYNHGDICSWWIKGQPGKKIKLWFDRSSGFSVQHTPLYGGLCLHWVEIKYNGNMTETGPRYCGDEKYMYNQNETITSTYNEVLIHFNTEYVSTSTTLTGFKLCYELDSTDHSSAMVSVNCQPYWFPYICTGHTPTNWTDLYKWWIRFWKWKWGRSIQTIY